MGLNRSIVIRALPTRRTRRRGRFARGGVILRLYENSLSLGLFLLFAMSFALQAVAGARVYNMEEVAHGGHTVTMVQHLSTAQF